MGVRFNPGSLLVVFVPLTPPFSFPQPFPPQGKLGAPWRSCQHSARLQDNRGIAFFFFFKSPEINYTLTLKEYSSIFQPPIRSARVVLLPRTGISTRFSVRRHPLYSKLTHNGQQSKRRRWDVDETAGFCRKLSQFLQVRGV